MIRHLILFAILTTACAPRPKPGDVLGQARSLLSEASETGSRTQILLQNLEQRRNGIAVQGRGLTDEELTFMNKVDHLLARFKDWEENLPELPNRVAGDPDTFLQKYQNYLDTIQAIHGEAAILTQTQ